MMLPLFLTVAVGQLMMSQLKHEFTAASEHVARRDLLLLLLMFLFLLIFLLILSLLPPLPPSASIFPILLILLILILLLLLQAHSEEVSRERLERQRLERDLEEASRRLSMAHQEIRRLNNELDAAKNNNLEPGGLC